ncbi:MAG TPA: hypothetical protein VK970_07690, partial [Candidatus Methylacidiphilales bacterium]|nr:hypothetical protein [Candidatus Methylacidiphilales bacterium]
RGIRAGRVVGDLLAGRRHRRPLSRCWICSCGSARPPYLLLRMGPPTALQPPAKDARIPRPRLRQPLLPQPQRPPSKTCSWNTPGWTRMRTMTMRTTTRIKD